MSQTVPMDSRLDKILFLLKKRGRMMTKDLSNIFHVSDVTIRNDLNELSKQGLVIRSYGGATIVGPQAAAITGQPLQYTDTDRDNIGKIAAGLVTDGDVLFIDSSRASVNLADNIRERKHLTVFTNSVEIAYKLSSSSGCTVYIAGGKINNEIAAVQGTFINRLLGSHNIAKAFLGAWGITPEHGLTDPRPDEAGLKREIITRAREVIGLIESARWGRVSLSSFAPVSDFDTIVTDSKAGSSMLEYLRKNGITCIQHESLGENKKSAVKGKTRKSAYAFFEDLRIEAKAGKPYQGQPGKRFSIAFANGLAEEPFCQDLEKSFIQHARFAGFAEENIHVFDNRYDEQTAMENARRILSLKPDIFVQFQINVKMNHIIADMFAQAGIPLLAVEIPIPSAPFIGTNNWVSASKAGEFAVNIMKKKYADISDVDLIVLIQMTAGGELNLFRSEGFAAAIVSAFGDEIEDKIIRKDGGTSAPKGTRTAMEEVLREYPDAGRIVVTCINDETMHAVIQVLKEQNRWNPARQVLVSHGADRIGRRHVREGLVDGSIAHFPEIYGEYILPAACAILKGEAVPPYIYIDNVMITKENIDTFYRKEG